MGVYPDEDIKVGSGVYYPAAERQSGAGPAGLTAALYTCRAKLNTLIIERQTIGGELMNRDLIENYPGYPGGILGPELGSNIMNQAMDYGVEVQLVMVSPAGDMDVNITRAQETDRDIRIQQHEWLEPAGRWSSLVHLPTTDPPGYVSQ